MGTRENKFIKMRADSILLDELIWPATRYCIGRHSYVSSYAETYWSIIKEGWDSFNQSRLQFYARDIKTEISNHMNWWDNVKTINAYNDIIKYDSYFLLSKYFSEHPDCVFADNDFEIDCVSGEITVTKRETPVKDSLVRMPEWDLPHWSKLASAISDRYEVETNNAFDGPCKMICIVSYDYCRYDVKEDWRYEKHYHPIGKLSHYIPLESIQSVKPVNINEEDN